MKLQLFGIDQAPRALPIWETILADLSNPPAPRVARVLGVGASTVYRWNQTGRAPRSACLALFWLTRWGRSEVHAQAVNDAILAASCLRSLQDELDRTRLELARVLALNASGAANHPLLRWPHG
jgi:predicted DNA-binding transcriptional regulator AlpA